MRYYVIEFDEDDELHELIGYSDNYDEAVENAKGWSEDGIDRGHTVKVFELKKVFLKKEYPLQ